MQCFIYASVRQPDSYLWLAQRDDFDRLPPSLLQLLGSLRFVMALELDPQRKLPVEDVAVVIEHLRHPGWHLQAPPPQTLALANHPAYGQSLADAADG